MSNQNLEDRWRLRRQDTCAWFARAFFFNMSLRGVTEPGTKYSVLKRWEWPYRFICASFCVFLLSCVESHFGFVTTFVGWLARSGRCTTDTDFQFGSAGGRIPFAGQTIFVVRYWGTALLLQGVRSSLDWCFSMVLFSMTGAVT